MRVLSGGELALRPAFLSPSLKATDGANVPRGGERGPLVATAGPAPTHTGVSISARAGVLALFLPRDSPSEGRKVGGA